MNKEEKCQRCEEAAKTGQPVTFKTLTPTYVA